VLDAFSLLRSPFTVRRALLPKTALLAVSFVLVLVVVLVLEAFSVRRSPFTVRLRLNSRMETADSADFTDFEGVIGG
jgi:hypothetical protein